MRKKQAGIYALIIVFCAVTATAQKSLSEIDLTKETEAAQRLVNSGIKFKTELDADGDGFTMTQGKFSDGTFITSTSRRFETAIAAQEYLKNQIKDAVKSIKRKQESFITSKGKTVYREEGIVILKGKGDNDYKFYLYSITDRYLDETLCDSLKHLLVSEIWGKQENKTP